MKILIQLEIEYNQYPSGNSYNELIKKIKNHYENNHEIPETEAIKFKSLGVVKISRVIQ